MAIKDKCFAFIHTVFRLLLSRKNTVCKQAGVLFFILWRIVCVVVDRSIFVGMRKGIEDIGLFFSFLKSTVYLANDVSPIVISNLADKWKNADFSSPYKLYTSSPW